MDPAPTSSSHSSKKIPDLTTIILTFNSEGSLSQVIDSCQVISQRILVVDSYSTDATLEIAKSYACDVVQHEFENYAAQRNWAQSYANLSPQEWVLHLDSDEVLSPQLSNHIYDTLSQHHVASGVEGYLMRRLSYFLNHPIRFGHINPSWHLRLFKAGAGRCEDRLYDQHFIVEGKTQKLKGLLYDLQLTTVERWIQSHNRWSTAEAREILLQKQGSHHSSGKTLAATLSGDPRMQKRWLKNKIYYKSPLFLRAILFFLYSYFLRLGFLDGQVGLVYHVLQAFWFRFLVDAKLLEQTLAAQDETESKSFS
jgi:glycosyltransferase involved in cell wall biosynthesis